MLLFWHGSWHQSGAGGDVDQVEAETPSIDHRQSLMAYFGLGRWHRSGRDSIDQVEAETAFGVEVALVQRRRRQMAFIEIGTWH